MTKALQAVTHSHNNTKSQTLTTTSLQPTDHDNIANKVAARVRRNFSSHLPTAHSATMNLTPHQRWTSQGKCIRNKCHVILGHISHDTWRLISNLHLMRFIPTYSSRWFSESFVRAIKALDKKIFDTPTLQNFFQNFVSKSSDLKLLRSISLVSYSIMVSVANIPGVVLPPHYRKRQNSTEFSRDIPWRCRDYKDCEEVGANCIVFHTFTIVIPLKKIHATPQYCWLLYNFTAYQKQSIH